MKYDLIDLPGEINDIPECGACYDTGIITDEDVFCDCPKGEAACDASDFIDSSAQLWYNRNMENTHKCGACEDNGFIDEQETVYCDCPSGDLMADIDAEFRAEEEAEARGTDYAYAVDSQGDDSPPSDWY